MGDRRSAAVPRQCAPAAVPTGDDLESAYCRTAREAQVQRSRLHSRRHAEHTAPEAGVAILRLDGDAASGEMSEGDVDSIQLREVGALRREIDDLRQLEKGP